jgi:hypothetical protein
VQLALQKLARRSEAVLTPAVREKAASFKKTAAKQVQNDERLDQQLVRKIKRSHRCKSQLSGFARLELMAKRRKPTPS